MMKDAGHGSLYELIREVEALTPERAPLERLESAVMLADGLATLADQLVEHFIEVARSAGHSWSAVGNALGVSKQAAQQRFVGRLEMMRLASTSERRDLWGRFNDGARAAIVRGQEAGHSMRHNFIGTEHLLLGIMRTEAGIAARALRALDVNEQSVAERIAEIVPPGPPIDEPRLVHTPFTARSKNVLTLTLGEAMRLGHGYIGTEHILLALLAESEGVAAQVLHALGVTYARARAEILRLRGAA